MRGAVEAARREHQRRVRLFGRVEELLERLVGLFGIHQEQHRIGDEPRQRDEVGTVGFHRAAEQLVDFGVTGDAGVVRQQRIAVGLGRSDNLRADLTGGAGLGFDHDRLLEDRLHR